MINNDFESIIQWHPEMILISETPFTWQGFLKVLNTSGRNVRFKLKIIVPNYPLLRDAEIYFGKEISIMRDTEFSEKLKNLMYNSSKVSTFLRQLQSLIGNFFSNNYHFVENNGYQAVDNYVVETLEELKDVLNVPSDTSQTQYKFCNYDVLKEIKVLSNSSLNRIKLCLNNVTVELQRNKYGGCPWTVVHSDLPEIPALGSFEKNVSKLAIARNKLKMQVDILDKAWSNLKQIDEICWVLDPLEPKPCHLYRQIRLTSALSIFIKIDALNPNDLPDIKFLGSGTEVESKKELVSKNLHNWDSRCNFIDNLMMLLGIETFPKKGVQKTEDESALVADEECCICFSLELDSIPLPDQICNNTKCRRRFHTPCLLQWLQTIAGNHVAFNHIHGSCPNCEENISCRIESGTA